jgi:hypothetical protein
MIKHIVMWTVRRAVPEQRTLQTMNQRVFATSGGIAHVVERT